MNKYKDKIVIRKEMLKHPAAIAWSEFCSGQEPTCIEVLKKTHIHSVFCLKGVGICGTDVIAKQSSQMAASIEQKIYEEILPNLPLPSLHFYGIFKDSKSVWIFREFTQGINFSPTLKLHRQLAAKWLATLHTTATTLKNIELLTDRTSHYYKERVILARQKILQNISNSWITSKQRKMLQKILSLLDLIESEWKQMDQICSEMPNTIVQGDFVEKNLHIQIGQEGPKLICLDWDHAGFGVPAVDLHGWRSHPDLSIYLKEIRKAGWNFDRQEINEQVKVGNLFRCIAAIYWESESLAFPWIEKSISLLQSYQINLSKSITTFQKMR